MPTFLVVSTNSAIPLGQVRIAAAQPSGRTINSTINGANADASNSNTSLLPGIEVLLLSSSINYTILLCLSATMSSDDTPAVTDSSSSTLLSYLWPVMYRCGQVVFGILAVAAGLLYVQQESLLYFPTVANIPRHNAQNPRGYKHPGERGLEYSSHIISNNEDEIGRAHV